jgi:hypothetical protein
LAALYVSSVTNLECVALSDLNHDAEFDSDPDFPDPDFPDFPC